MIVLSMNMYSTTLLFLNIFVNQIIFICFLAGQESSDLIKHTYTSGLFGRMEL